MTSSTSPTDYRVIKQLQMMRFKGERWGGFGPKKLREMLLRAQNCEIESAWPPAST